MLYLHQKQELIDIKSIKNIDNPQYCGNKSSNDIIVSNSGLIFQAITKFDAKAKISIFVKGYKIPSLETYILPLN